MLVDVGGAHIATHLRADLCGAANYDTAFTITGGLGAIWSATDGTLTPSVPTRRTGTTTSSH